MVLSLSYPPVRVRVATPDGQIPDAGVRSRVAAISGTGQAVPGCSPESTDTRARGKRGRRGPASGRRGFREGTWSAFSFVVTRSVVSADSGVPPQAASSIRHWHRTDRLPRFRRACPSTALDKRVSPECSHSQEVVSRSGLPSCSQVGLVESTVVSVDQAVSEQNAARLDSFTRPSPRSYVLACAFPVVSRLQGDPSLIVCLRLVGG